MPAYGVNITDDEMAEWIEDQRIRTRDGSREVVPRTQVIRECIELDKAITECLEDPPDALAAEAYLPARDTERRGFARQLVLDALRYRSLQSER